MMGLMKWLRSIAAGALRAAGVQLHATSRGPLTMEDGLRAFAGRFRVGTVIDVGASNGSWTEAARPCWPEAAFLLVEAQGGPHLAHLEALRSRDPGVDFVIAAAGDRVGTIHFDAADPFGGIASRSGGAGRVEVPMTTIDAEVERRALKAPFLLKLDTHGFELPILAGAARTLARTDLVVVEVYNFTVSEGALQFPDLCRHMAGLGFRPIAIVDVMCRPSDGVLWQFDCFFARAEIPELQRHRYA
jgi:FkbM family methyltransferase